MFTTSGPTSLRYTARDSFQRHDFLDDGRKRGCTSVVAINQGDFYRTFFNEMNFCELRNGIEIQDIPAGPGFVSSNTVLDARCGAKRVKSSPGRRKITWKMGWKATIV